MGRCVYACNGDRNCMSDCNDDFLERQLDCPCEVGFISKRGLRFIWYESYLFRKIVLVVVHAQIILALKRLPLQMPRLPLNQTQPLHQQPMPSWFWVPEFPPTNPWSLISMVSRFSFKFELKFVLRKYQRKSCFWVWRWSNSCIWLRCHLEWRILVFRIW